MATDALTPRESAVMDHTAMSLGRTEDFEHTLVAALLDLRTIATGDLPELDRLLVQHNAVLTALLDHDWHELNEWAGMVEHWHYDRPCICSTWRGVTVTP